MRVLVTGAAGFIGSHVTQGLLGRGDQVVALDSFDPYYDPSRKRRNLEGLGGRAGFRLVEGDILDPAALEASFAPPAPEAVIHLAALAGVRASIEEPARYAEVNVLGTLRVLEAARAAGTRRLVFASSSAVYGGQTRLPFREADRVDRPVSPYAATKLAGELLCHTWHHLHGLAVTCLRFFTVYGPRGRPDMAVWRFTEAIARGEPVAVYGDGSARRDFTYIDDCVAGVLAALDRCAGYAVYNLGESRTTRVADLIQVIGQAVGRRAEARHLPEVPGDVPATWADIGRARAALGYEPRWTVEAGVRRFVEWYRAEVGRG
ncbi:MAG: NAD-dependent epimerase/dehydratase family protein [Planctomycetes bacterium]|nr:NAD-dependent epimerase/dehydratase family protein [Planctomycetota bacterium]